MWSGSGVRSASRVQLVVGNRASVLVRSVGGKVLRSHTGGVRGWRGLPANQGGVLTPRVLKVCVLAHVFSDGGIADSVGGSGQASFATVAGATAVETGHVNAVQVIVHTAP